MAQFTNHNSNAPVDFAADRIEVQNRSDRAILSGNVKVTQGGLVMTAQRLTVAYTGKVSGGDPQVNRLDAAGNVHVRSGDQSASGQIAVYDLDRRIITMVGGVSLTQSSNSVRGNRLVIDLDSGRSVIDGSIADGTRASDGRQSDGRVTGRLSVPQRSQAGTPRQ